MLVGREAEVAELRRALTPEPGGAPRLVVLVGETGGGSSAVVDEVLAGVAGSFATWSRGACRPAHGALVLIDLLQNMRTDRPPPPDPTPAVTAVADGLTSGRLTAATFPLDIAQAVLHLVEQVCARGPALAVLEDLHHGEPAVLSLTRFLLRQLPGLRLSFLLTSRTHAAVGPVATTVETARAAGGRVVELGPLSPEVVTRIAADALGRPAPPALQARLAAASGNPALVQAVLADAAGPAVPGTAWPEAARRMLAGLDPRTRQVVGAAAVLGPRCEVETLAAVVGTTVFSLAPVLDDAAAHRLVDITDGRVTFRHELVREVAYQSHPPGLRAALHRECAAVLAAHGAPPDPVAEHRLRGDEPRPRPGRGVPGGPVLDALTPAEQRVVRLAAQGLSNQQIASALSLSRYTVETHLKHVFQRLGLHSRAQLAALVALDPTPSRQAAVAPLPGRGGNGRR